MSISLVSVPAVVKHVYPPPPRGAPIDNESAVRYAKMGQYEIPNSGVRPSLLPRLRCQHLVLVAGAAAPGGSPGGRCHGPRHAGLWAHAKVRRLGIGAGIRAAADAWACFQASSLVDNMRASLSSPPANLKINQWVNQSSRQPPHVFNKPRKIILRASFSRNAPFLGM